MSLARALRAVVKHFGYVLWKRDFLRYGIDPFLDVFRISQMWGRSIETVFDVGAHRGETTLEALSAFPQARIWAFEPQPRVFNAMVENCLDSRTSLMNLALGEKQGVVTMYEYGDEGGAAMRNSLVPNARSAVQYGFEAVERTVECSSVDIFCTKNSIARIDLLKIDVEGFELSVLKGAEQMLKAGRVGFVYLEFNDLLPDKASDGGALMPIAQYLAQFGYRYISAYTDFVGSEHFKGNQQELFVVANALFALPPS